MELRRWSRATQRFAASALDLKPPGRSRDPDPRPIFIIGAARSGTSVVTRALLQSTSYKGNDEGHLIELIGQLDRIVDHVYSMKERDIINDRNNIMIKAAGRDFLSDGIASIFVSATQQIFPRWFVARQNTELDDGVYRPPLGAYLAKRPIYIHATQGDREHRLQDKEISWLFVPAMLRGMGAVHASVDRTASAVGRASA